MTGSEKLNGAATAAFMRPGNMPNYDKINWSKLEKAVKLMQLRIAKAQQQGKTGKVKSLSRILTRSFAAKALAVRQITSNKGSKTSGVDKEIWLTSEQKAQAIIGLNHDGYKAKPLRRKYILKKNGKRRPLGIPTMKDRAMQALHAMALLPIAETTADPNSYGFRPHRSCMDAIGQITLVFHKKKRRPQWVFEGDIKGCFDNIDHNWILSNIPVEKHVLRQWLKSGYVEGNSFSSTDAGTPQGGVISPIIANMVLDGLETELRSKFKIQRTNANGKTRWVSPNLKTKPNKKVNFVRYADDFIISGISEAVLREEVKPIVETFLHERGLELSEEKTLITHISKGFDFLGFTIKTYDGDLLIKPSKKSAKNLYGKTGEILDRCKTARADFVVDKLNPILRGWTNYYRYVSSSRVFTKVHSQMWGKLWRWSMRRHNNKGKNWIADKYFTKAGNRKWVFFGTDTKGKLHELLNAGKVKLLSYRKIKSDSNPFAEEWQDYFVNRSKPGQKLRKPKWLP